ILHHAVDFQGNLEIDLHLSGRSYDAVDDAVLAADAARGWVDADAEVVEGDVPPGPSRAIRTAQCVGVRELPLPARALERNGHEQAREYVRPSHRWAA